MNKPKFKIGDRLYHYGQKCVVMDIFYKHGHYEYEIVYDENQTSNLALETQLMLIKESPSTDTAEGICNPFLEPKNKTSFEVLLDSLNLKEEELTSSCKKLIKEYRDFSADFDKFRKNSSIQGLGAKNLIVLQKDLDNLESDIIKKIKWFSNNKHLIEERIKNMVKGKRKAYLERQNLPIQEVKQKGRPKKNKISFPPIPITFPTKDWGAIQQADDFSIYVREVKELKEMIANLTEIVLKQNQDVETKGEKSKRRSHLEDSINALKVGQKRTFFNYSAEKIQEVLTSPINNKKSFHVTKFGTKSQVYRYE
jgi:hypothetical protein